MKADRDCETAEIFIKTMKKQKPNSHATHGSSARSKSNTPPIGEAVAWLRREKDVFKRCLELVKAHPVLIYDDSMDCLWEFLEPILKKCASDQGKKHMKSPKRAFLEGQLHVKDTKDRMQHQGEHSIPPPSPNRMAATTPTRIPVRSPRAGERGQKRDNSPSPRRSPRRSDREDDTLNTQPVLPPIGMRMGRRRSSSTSELIKLCKISEISEGQPLPPIIDQFKGSEFNRPQVTKPQKTSSAEDIHDLTSDDCFIKTTYVVYKGEQPPQVVQFPEKLDIRRDSIFKYLDSDTDSITLPLDVSFSDIDDRRLSNSSEFSYGY